MKSKLIIAVVLIAIVCTGLFFYNKYQVAPGIKFQSIELTDLNGHPVSFDSFQNKNVFINFFATWCGPCIAELPALENAQQILAKEDIQFILISDEPEELLKKLQPSVQLPILHSKEKLSDLKIHTIPTSYLLNKNQEIVFKKTGAASWNSESNLDEIRKALR